MQTGNKVPFFSIVIPTYNREEWIGAAVASVLAQEFREFELLVIDDGSTDNTSNAVKEIKDDRLRYWKKENGERGAARNFGARLAKGRYVNFFDSDDLMYPNHLQTAYEKSKEWNSPEFFHLGYDYKTAQGELLRVVNQFNGSLVGTVLHDNVLSCNGVFVRNDIVRQFPFEEDRRLASAEDWELWIRLISRFPLYFSNAVTSTIVSHSERSIHVINPDKVIARDLLLIEKLKNDSSVMRQFGPTFRKFVANRYTYIMLCLATAGRMRELVLWARRAFQAYPQIVLSARYLASLKKIVLR